MSTAIQHYEMELQRSRANLPWALSVPWQHRREAGWARFAAQGFPTLKHEEWKYTPLNALEKHTFSCAVDEPPSLTWGQLEQRVVMPDARHRVVFVDGVFQPALSILGQLPDGVRVRVLSHLSEEDSLPLMTLLEQAQSRTPFAALNAAFMAEGAWITVAAGVQVDEPLLVLHVSTTPHRAQHLVLAYELAGDSALVVMEQYLGLTDDPYLVNVASGKTLSPGARLTHVKVQEEGQKAFHMASTQANLKRDSHLVSHAFAMRGALGRNDTEVVLAGTGAHVALKGLYEVEGKSLQDFHTTIRHDSPDCSSEQYFKGVLKDSGRAVFNGKIQVARDAQHTQSRQANHNLLLSDQAEVDTKPQLEILADDVKCSHGATIGQLDEDQWFYLRSRGVGAEEARLLLIAAFAMEMVDVVEPAVMREALNHHFGRTGHA